MTVNAKILVVEAEPGIVDSLRDNLEQAGFDVITVNDSAAGLNQIRSGCPDLIIADSALPGIDGMKIRANDSTGAPVPVLLLTSRDEAPGILDFQPGDSLSKRFSPRELLLQVTTHVNAAKEALFTNIMEGAFAA